VSKAQLERRIQGPRICLLYGSHAGMTVFWVHWVKQNMRINFSLFKDVAIKILCYILASQLWFASVHRAETHLSSETPFHPTEPSPGDLWLPAAQMEKPRL
jgi:hypothetical protein